MRWITSYFDIDPFIRHNAHLYCLSLFDNHRAIHTHIRLYSEGNADLAHDIGLACAAPGSLRPQISAIQLNGLFP